MSLKENWSGGDDYDYYMGRWSRKTAELFFTWLNADQELIWLDIGCGTGALTQKILEQHLPDRVYAIDPSWNFVHHVLKNLQSPQLDCLVSFADALPLTNNICDIVVSGLMLNFAPDPISALLEMGRVVKSGGTVAAYVWDYADKMEWLRYFWDAALEMDPLAKDFDEGQRFPLCQQGKLFDTFRQAGLRSVELIALDTVTDFPDFNAYWAPFLSGAFPAPQYLKSLSQDKQFALQNLLRAKVPIEPDGSIHLIARAWAVRGVTP